MTHRLSWHAVNGAYFIDVVISGIATRAMIDTGLIDPAQQVAL